MRLPRWLKRLGRGRSVDTGHEEPEAPETGETMTTPSDEALRAARAARAAAMHLQESRARGSEVDQRATRTEHLTSDNHFADLIRNAFGGNT